MYLIVNIPDLYIDDGDEKFTKNLHGIVVLLPLLFYSSLSVLIALTFLRKGKPSTTHAYSCDMVQ